MQLLNIFDYRDLARKRLPGIAFDYLERGAEDEITLRRNREIFTRITYNPRVLTGVSTVDLSRTLFGRQYKLPVIIGPTGFAGLFWPHGDAALARAAGAAGIPYVLSTFSSSTIEEIAKIPDVERWFQIYAFKDDRKTDAMIARARDAGYTGLVLTVDTAVAGNREASMRHGANIPMPITVPFLLDVLSHPHWAYQMLRYGTPRLINLETENGAKPPRRPMPFSFDALAKRSLSWNDVTRLRSLWRGAFIVKGIQSAEDARIATHAGVDGIVLSNHGGRQLDGSPSAIELLPEVAASAGKELLVMVDGGVLRGSDVVKAIALGAHAVWLGRAPLYGLAARGEAGVSAVLNILRQEMERTMVLLGVDRIGHLHPGCLQPFNQALASQISV
jgi:(S)-mandelate dehydrogenase